MCTAVSSDTEILIRFWATAIRRGATLLSCLSPTVYRPPFITHRLSPTVYPPNLLCYHLVRNDLHYQPEMAHYFVETVETGQMFAMITETAYVKGIPATYLTA